MIICGDFNSPPHTLPYQLLSRAHVDDVMLDKLRRTCQFDDPVTSTCVFLVSSNVRQRPTSKRPFDVNSSSDARSSAAFTVYIRT